jgi:hypothetical protein
MGAAYFLAGNLTLLCRPHHRRIDQDGWTIRSIDGVPHYLAPKWYDPDQVPRRNQARRSAAALAPPG